MTQKLTPIATQYHDIDFRSRTEARWAVYFDTIGIRWEYEAEGFHLPNGRRYLPDFWLPDFLMFAEVKAGLFTHEEEVKSASLDCPCIMLECAPAERPYFVAECTMPQGYGIDRWPIHPVVGFEDDRWPSWAVCLTQQVKKDAAPAALRFWVADADRYSSPECDGCCECREPVSAAKRYRFWR